MEIRKSEFTDIDRIMAIYAIAKDFMAAHGNGTQWQPGYPGEEQLRTDIQRGCSYVFVENGAVVGVFTFIIGPEPTYQVIKNGHWRWEETYGTIHRLASDGTARGLARACFAYCADQCGYLRVDTHRDNLSMQAAIERFGFQRCGNIYVRDGSERIAYDYIREDGR